MTREQEFYNKVEDEYNDFLQEVAEYDCDEVLCEADRIAKIQSIYKFLMDYRPVDEDSCAEFMEIKDPLDTIYQRYNPCIEEYHEELYGLIEDLSKEYRAEQQKNAVLPESVSKLLTKIYKEGEKYANILSDRVDKKAWFSVLSNINTVKYHFDEYDAKILLQFKEPLFVLAKEIGNTTESFEKQLERAVENLKNVDLLIYQHELNKDAILPETKHRHNAIIELMDIVPDFQFQTAMSWLDLNRTINESMLDGEDNPYQEFLDAMKEIKEKHGDEILQKAFDMGVDVVVQPIELTEVAKYIADGGDVDRVSELLEDDFFLVPYEQHKEGGMDLC